jgi:hypothetical protein
MDRVARGYGLFFLAHACVLDMPELGGTAVERLTALYHQLDYPDDPEMASEVASELASVLSAALNHDPSG